jgi:hypothetical protein
MFNRSSRVWLFGLLACLGGGCDRAMAAAAPGFAVVELFTSEGCSSCPPADAVLGNLADAAAKTGRPVYTLAFHVNYWDNREWRDPYSTVAGTQHQRAYAAALHGRGVYTPQLVVNGREELVGSDAAKADSSIATALAGGGSSQLQVSARRVGERVSVDYQLPAAPEAGSVLRLALVQAEATGHVLGGENAGRVLRHVNVVRAFETLPLTAASAGRGSLTWPKDLDSASATLVAYVQQRGNTQITAATRAPVAQPG